MRTILFLAVSILFTFPATGQTAHAKANKMNDQASKLDTATLGAGCFWCVEAIFQNLKGVEKVSSGYTGDKVPNPSYEEVCTGMTGHAEVAQVVFDPNVISYGELLEVFWQTHDPTTLNRQGADVGPQYRSAIFYHNEQQRELAAGYKTKPDESGADRKSTRLHPSP